MRRAGKSKRNASRENGSDGRTAAIIRAMEEVFRSTHEREMTAEERQDFRLPPPPELGTRNVTAE